MGHLTQVVRKVACGAVLPLSALFGFGCSGGRETPEDAASSTSQALVKQTYGQRT